jgi:hypothetical protein
MIYHYAEELAFMELVRGSVIKYDQETLHMIKELAESDNLDGLMCYIRLKLL